MSVKEWLVVATKQLEEAGVTTARLDALILLEDATDKDRGWLLAHPEYLLTGSDLVKLDEQVGRRAGHEPLAYIRGKGEFYGRLFKVTPATLQPRPETETMIDLLKKIYSQNLSLLEVRPLTERRIVDVGTGSGCLAITAKLEWPELDVYATEINNDALEVAKINANNLSADVKFFQGNLLEPLLTLNPSPSTLICNLPYVPDSHTINQVAMQEPKIAIFGGEDGLDLYRELFGQLRPVASALHPQFILTECLPFQHKDLENIAKESGYTLKETDDFIQLFEVT